MVCSDLPGEHGGHHPGGHANHQRPRFGAHVARFQRFANGVVALERDGQNGQHAGVGDGQLDERHRFAWCQPAAYPKTITCQIQSSKVKDRNMKMNSDMSRPVVRFTAHWCWRTNTHKTYQNANAFTPHRVATMQQVARPRPWGAPFTIRCQTRIMLAEFWIFVSRTHKQIQTRRRAPWTALWLMTWHSNGHYGVGISAHALIANCPCKLLGRAKRKTSPPSCDDEPICTHCIIVALSRLVVTPSKCP